MHSGTIKACQRAEETAIPNPFENATEGLAPVPQTPITPQTSNAIRHLRNQLDQLTERQVQIITLWSGGNANKDIASKLDCGLTTIEHDRTKIRRNLGIQSLAELLSPFLEIAKQTEPNEVLPRSTKEQAEKIVESLTPEDLVDWIASIISIVLEVEGNIGNLTKPADPYFTPENLTKRQGLVLRLVTEGKRNKDIARMLDCGLRTVELERAIAFKQLEISSVPQTSFRALKRLAEKVHACIDTENA